MMLARGIAQVITQGSQRNTNLPDNFGMLGNMTFFENFIPVARRFHGCIGVARNPDIEKRTVFGRLTYWIGANSVASSYLELIMTVM